MAGARRRIAATLAVLALTAGLVACGSDPRRTPVATTRPAVAPTVWLCRPTDPGRDPCDQPFEVTAVTAGGATRYVPVPEGDPDRVACFYVYPTSSRETTDNADLRIQAGELSAARAQAAPFSPDCAVWAPVYHQVTIDGLARALAGEGDASAVAYASVRAAFESFLAAIGPQVPIVFVGHSQGTAMLIRLLRQLVDPDPALRDRVVAALLLGGNVTVAAGRSTGGSFSHLPLCTRPGQDGCVIAYSTFGRAVPPGGAVFGRPGQGISLMSDQRARHGVTVACTDPAGLGATGTTPIDPLFTTEPLDGLLPHTETRFVTFPGIYRATCRSADGATWLQVTASTDRADHRPRVTAALGPDWGYHQDDVNLAQLDLLADVRRAEDTWLATHRPRAGRPTLTSSRRRLAD